MTRLICWLAHIVNKLIWAGKTQGPLLWVFHGCLTACSWPRHGSSPFLNDVAKVLFRCCRYFITLCWRIGVIVWTYYWSKSSQIMFRLLNCCPHGHPTGIFGIFNHTWAVLYLYVKGNILFDATIRKDCDNHLLLISNLLSFDLWSNCICLPGASLTSWCSYGCITGC